MKALIITLLLASTAYAQSTTSRVVHMSGAAFDLGTTLAANHYTPELNPIMGQKPAQQITVMGGLVFALDRLTISAGREHPRFATTFNIMAGLMHFAAGSWNLSVMRSNALKSH